MIIADLLQFVKNVWRISRINVKKWTNWIQNDAFCWNMYEFCTILRKTVQFHQVMLQKMSWLSYSYSFLEIIRWIPVKFIIFWYIYWAKISVLKNKNNNALQDCSKTDIPFVVAYCCNAAGPKVKSWSA